MADEKIIERVEKLLRRAAPDSGNTDNEIEIASREVVRLILKHRLTLREAPPIPPPSADPVREAWVLNIAPSYAGCQACGGTISPRDAVWIRVTLHNEIQYRHNYDPCRVK